MINLPDISSRQKHWTEVLTQTASKPLVFCSDFPEIARRWERWWRCACDRPLLGASVRKNGHSNIRWDKPFDLLDRPAEWLRVVRTQMENRIWSRDTVPCLRVDLGPVVTAAFLGAPLEFALEENTSWQKPVIEAWHDDAIPPLDPENRWLQTVLKLSAYAARDAAGRYLVALPDFSGAFDVLANLRGTEKLLLDLYDNPAVLGSAAARILEAWEHAFAMTYDAILDCGAGVTSWLHVWSNTAYTVPTCDFNYMISREHFKLFVMPSLAEQARRAGRCLFHLDGPGAAKHAETLAEEPSITAVQFTPGAANPSAVPWIPMFQMLQRAGKPLVIECLCSDVPQLVDKLDHRGLVLRPGDVGTPQAVESLERLIGAI